jgi:membrane protein DedA with SNARE-associated domain
VLASQGKLNIVVVLIVAALGAEAGGERARTP